MKRFCVILLSLLCATHLSAGAKGPAGAGMPRVRIEWGAHAGVGFWGYGNGSTWDLKGKTGWQAGISMAAVWGRWALQPEVRYLHHGIEFEPAPGIEGFDVKSNLIEVPVLVSLRIARILRLNVGPVLTVMDRCEYTGSDGLSRDVGRTRSTLGYAVGTAVKPGKHWLVDLRYTGGFGSVENVFRDGGPAISMRGYSVQLSVGYVF